MVRAASLSKPGVTLFVGASVQRLNQRFSKLVVISDQSQQFALRAKRLFGNECLALALFYYLSNLVL